MRRRVKKKLKGAAARERKGKLPLVFKNSKCFSAFKSSNFFTILVLTFFYFIFRVNLLDLPDKIIIHIFGFFFVKDILTSVSKVNKGFNSLVKNYPTSWKTIELNDVITLDESILKIISNSTRI